MTETIISEELPQIQIQTDRGEITLEMFEDDCTDDGFLKLGNIIKSDLKERI